MTIDISDIYGQVSGGLSKPADGMNGTGDSTGETFHEIYMY